MLTIVQAQEKKKGSLLTVTSTQKPHGTELSPLVNAFVHWIYFQIRYLIC